MNFTECERPGIVECFALVRSCDKKTSKNGSTYLDIVIADKSSEMSVKVWDFRDGMFIPEPNSIIKIRGQLQQYNGVDQLIAQRMRAATDDDNINKSDYVKTADYTGEDMFNIISDIVSGFADEDIKNVTCALLGEHKDELLYFPAAEKLHHAINGGLLYHTLSIVRLAQSICEIYPCVDSDLLVSGAILHDIAKLKEYTVNAVGMVDGHTVSGMLLGHLVMGSEEIGRKCDELSVPEEKKVLLQHMLISHHGKPEFGAAIRPGFIEAEVLSQLDLLDANMYEMADALKDTKKGEFTGRLWMLDNRKLYNHGRVDIAPKANLSEDE